MKACSPLVRIAVAVLLLPQASVNAGPVAPQMAIREEVIRSCVSLMSATAEPAVELDRIQSFSGRMWRSVNNPDLYYVKLQESDSQESLFNLYERFARDNRLAWIYKHDHPGISEEQRASRRAKQFGDFVRAAGLEPFPQEGGNRWMCIPLKSLHPATVEPDSQFTPFPPIRQLLKGTGRLIDAPPRSMTALREHEASRTIAAVDFSLAPGGLSWQWKLANPLQHASIGGLDMVAFDTRPFFNHDQPERGGDVHGVSGGLTKQFALHERPDIRDATHYSFLVANTGEQDFYLSIEFFDYDAALDDDKDGFSNNPNHVERDYSNESQQDYELRYDREFMQAGFESKLMVASGGLVDEYEYAKHRYDSYRYREFAIDGPKAQKLRIPASADGSAALYHVAIPVTPEFMQKHYINTGIGDGLVNIGSHDLQRIQYVIYATEKENQPEDKVRKLSHYKRLLSILEYYHDETACPEDPNAATYPGTTSALGGLGRTARFIKDPAQLDKLVITPVISE